MNGDKFYTITSSAESSTKIFFTRIGASDHSFNLRNEPGVLFRYNGPDHVFASVIEPHGIYDSVREFCSGAEGSIEEVKVIGSNDEATILQIIGKNKINWTLMINNGPSSDVKEHSVVFGNNTYAWKGNYKLVKK